MKEPITEFILEAPGGLVPIKAYCDKGKAKSIEIHNVASFADKLDATIEVEGVGTLQVDTAYGGDSFVLVDAKTKKRCISQRFFYPKIKCEVTRRDYEHFNSR